MIKQIVISNSSEADKEHIDITKQRDIINSIYLNLPNNSNKDTTSYIRKKISSYKSQDKKNVCKKFIESLSRCCI